MPLREYLCRNCRTKVECVEFGDDPFFHACMDCGEVMDQVEFSRPAPVRVGKYGKAGGLPPEAANEG